uniref:Uncharacterized protein n=1 Tax=Rhizophora mucronata TaxID=61149 RepID=A0A2P2MYM0_RHIMU
MKRMQCASWRVIKHCNFYQAEKFFRLNLTIWSLKLADLTFQCGCFIVSIVYYV